MSLPLHPACSKLPKGLTRLLEEELPSHAQRIDEENRVPKPLLDSLAAEGFFAVAVPRDYGGLGLGLPGLACTARIAARESIAVASIAVIHGGVALAVAEKSPAEAREELLPAMAKGESIAAVSITEPGGGSDLVANTRTTAALEGETWRITGEKIFTSNGLYATHYAVLARTNPENPREMTLIIAPKTSNITVEPLELTAFRGAGIARVRYNQAPAPKHYTIAQPGKGLRAALELINAGRITYAAMALGALESLIQKTLEHAAKKTLFNQKLIDHQGPRWTITKAYIEAYTIAHTLNNILDQTPPDPTAAAIIKTKATEAAATLAQQLTRLHGGRGLAKGATTERHLRDTIALTIGEGANEVLLETIAKTLTKQATKT